MPRSAIGELSEALRDGSATSAALVEQAYALADGDSAQHVFTLRLDAEARDEAAAADRRRAAGVASPFAGVPVTVKDNFDLRGRPTTAGSQVLAGAAPAAADAAVAIRLRQAGFVILGRTNMTELAFSGLGLNPHYGTPANPAFANADHIPGGSSSGAAVSVALGIVPAALGTDTGGSVRIPAAFCGLVGFKPTAAEVSRAGVLPLSTTLDSVGVIAHTVADCRVVFDVIRTVPAQPVQSRPVRRIGVVSNYVQDGVAPAVRAAFEAAMHRLSARGVKVEQVVVSALDEIPEMTRDGSFAAREAFEWRSRALADAPDEAFDPRVISRIRPGGAMSQEAYDRLRRRRAGFVADFAGAAEDFDALAWPTVPIIAPTRASLADEIDYHRVNGLVLRNSTVVNLADGCAISLACPTQGPPVGLTLAQAGGRDDDLLDAALAVETILSTSN